jgi:hypothetical protein
VSKTVKRVILIFSIILCTAILIWLFLFIYEYRSKQEQLFSTYALSKAEIDSLHDGDIILRHGYGLVSDEIVETLNHDINISHCAILTKDTNNQFIIIHSVSQSLSDFDGVQSQDLKSFIKDSKPNSVIVVRYKFKPGEDSSLIGKKAKYYLAKRIPFDMDFDLKDSTKIYCAELLWRIFKYNYNYDCFDTDHPELHGKNYHLTFYPFLDTAHFKIIINHHNRKQV